MAKLKTRENITNNIHTLKLSGNIDEDSNFNNIILNKSSTMLFDLQDVNNINSYGIREWINLMKNVPQESKVYFINCGRVIIEQVNMIENFLPKNSFIQSFYVPYYCDHCNEQTNVLIEREKDDITKPVYDFTTQCANCKTKEEAEIDVLENRYFKFLSRN